MRKKSKTAAGKSAAGKLTAPKPPLVDVFKFSKSLAREVQEASRLTGAPAEWLVQKAIESLTRSIDTDDTLRGDMRNSFVDDADKGGVCAVVAVGSPEGCYTITLTPELSREWDAAAKHAGLPLDWMLYDDLAAGAEQYQADATGWPKDSRKVWRALSKKERKVPIQVVKGGAK